jgi:hypothetical protein
MMLRRQARSGRGEKAVSKTLWECRHLRYVTPSLAHQDQLQLEALRRLAGQGGHASEWRVFRGAVTLPAGFGLLLAARRVASGLRQRGSGGKRDAGSDEAADDPCPPRRVEP